MKILGIDTILHDVCVSVVKDGRFVLSDINKHTVMESDKLYNLVDLHLNQIGLVTWVISINILLILLVISFKSRSLYQVFE